MLRMTNVTWNKKYVVVTIVLLLAGVMSLLFGTDYILTINGVSSYHFYPLWNLPTSVVWGSTTSTTVSVSHAVNYVGIAILLAGVGFGLLARRHAAKSRSSSELRLEIC